MNYYCEHQAIKEILSLHDSVSIPRHTISSSVTTCFWVTSGLKQVAIMDQRKYVRLSVPLFYSSVMEVIREALNLRNSQQLVSGKSRSSMPNQKKSVDLCINMRPETHQAASEYSDSPVPSNHSLQHPTHNNRHRPFLIYCAKVN